MKYGCKGALPAGDGGGSIHPVPVIGKESKKMVAGNALKKK